VREELTSDASPASSEDSLAVKTGAASAFSDFSVLMLGKVMLVPLGVGASALMARMLGAEGYGVLAVFSMLVSLMVLITSNWSLASVLRFGREEHDKTGRIHRTFWARNTILLPSLFLGCVALYLWREHVVDYLGTPAWTVWLVIVAVLAGAMAGYLDYILQALHRMKSLAASSVFRSLCGLLGVLVIWFGFLARDYVSVLVVGLCVNVVVTGLLAVSLVRPRNVLPLATDRKMLRDVFGFSYPIILGNLAAYTVNWVDVVVIKYYLAMSDVGTYQLAYGMFNSFAGWLGTITMLMFPIQVSFVAAGREDLIARYARHLVPQLVLTVAVAAGVSVGLAPLAFRLVYGQAFGPAGNYFQVLGAGLAFSVITYCYSGSINAFKLMKLAMLASVVRGVANLVGDLLLVPRIGPLGAAVATSLAAGLAAALYLAICQRKMKMKLIWQMLLVLPMLLPLLACQVLPEWWAAALGPLVALVSGYILARRLRVFVVGNAEFLEHIKMPTVIRYYLVRAHHLVSRFTATGSAGEHVE
jgi:O-antigen/teichoic acid export membrane protein